MTFWRYQPHDRAQSVDFLHRRSADLLTISAELGVLLLRRLGSAFHGFL